LFYLCIRFGVAIKLTIIPKPPGWRRGVEICLGGYQSFELAACCENEGVIIFYEDLFYDRKSIKFNVQKRCLLDVIFGLSVNEERYHHHIY
jgi:hypothetical protein